MLYMRCEPILIGFEAILYKMNEIELQNEIYFYLLFVILSRLMASDYIWDTKIMRKPNKPTK